MPQPPRIIQTVLPREDRPELSFVATWVKFENDLPDLKLLMPNISENLVVELTNWKQNVLVQPQRLLSALCTGNLELLEEEWTRVLNSLNIANTPISYLNKSLFEQIIVVEESPPLLKSLASVLIMAPAVYFGYDLLHHVVQQRMALGGAGLEAGLFVLAHGGVLVVEHGLKPTGGLLRRIVSWATGKPVVAAAPSPPGGSGTQRAFPSAATATSGANLMPLLEEEEEAP